MHRRGRKRQAPEAPAPPVPAFSNRLQMLPKDVGHLILQFCRYDGLKTALDFADVLLGLAPTVYWEVHLEELARLMPEYLKVSKGAPRAALQRELDEVKRPEKLRGLYLPAANRGRMQEWLREQRPKVCRFCACAVEATGSGDEKSRYNGALARGLSRRLGAYSLRLQIICVVHTSCFVARLLRLRQSADGTPAWNTATTASAMVRGDVNPNDFCQGHNGFYYVRAEAWKKAEERYRKARALFSEHVVPQLDRWLDDAPAVKLRDRMAALLGVPDTPGMLAELIRQMSAEQIDFMRMAGNAPSMTLSEAQFAVTEARTYGRVRALRDWIARFCQTHDDYARLIRLYGAFATGHEKLVETIVEVARSYSSERPSTFVFTSPSLAQESKNMLDRILWRQWA